MNDLCTCEHTHERTVYRCVLECAALAHTARTHRTAAETETSHISYKPAVSRISASTNVTLKCAHVKSDGFFFLIFHLFHMQLQKQKKSPRNNSADAPLAAKLLIHLNRTYLIIKRF